MKVKNIGQRGWFVGDKLIAPNCTAEVECKESDIAGNDELEIVVKVEDKPKVGLPAKGE